MFSKKYSEIQKSAPLLCNKAPKIVPKNFGKPKIIDENILNYQTITTTDLRRFNIKKFQILTFQTILTYFPNKNIIKF